jgi:hypothetical protein
MNFLKIIENNRKTRHVRKTSRKIEPRANWAMERKGQQ